MEGIDIDSIVRKAVTDYRKQEQEHDYALACAAALDRLREYQDGRSCLHLHTVIPSDVWACPICRNWFVLSDGSRVCTHDRTHSCKCLDMPVHLRRIRDLDLLRRAVVLSDLCGRLEKLEALERITEALRAHF